MKTSCGRVIWSHKYTMIAAVVTACLWHVGAQWLMDGYWRLNWREVLNPDWAIGTTLAGAYATFASIRFGRKTNGGEKWWGVLTTYHPAIILYWLGWFMSIHLFRNVHFQKDHLKLLGTFLVYGTFTFLAPPLLLGCWLSRIGIRKIHTHESRFVNNRKTMTP
jgi:hypothetical protein